MPYSSVSSRNQPIIRNKAILWKLREQCRNALARRLQTELRMSVREAKHWSEALIKMGEPQQVAQMSIQELKQAIGTMKKSRHEAPHRMQQQFSATASGNVIPSSPLKATNPINSDTTKRQHSNDYGSNVNPYDTQLDLSDEERPRRGTRLVSARIQKENEMWNKIAIYEKAMKEKEDKERRQKLEEQRRQWRETLNAQVEHKMNAKKMVQRQKRDDYYKLQEETNKYEEEQKKIQEMMSEKIAKDKQMREEQIRRRDEQRRRRIEKERQKEAENMTRLQRELEAERTRKKEAKEQQLSQMKNLLKENEVQRQEKLRKQRIEQEKEQKLAEDYMRQEEERMRKREERLNELSNKIKAKMDVMSKFKAEEDNRSAEDERRAKAEQERRYKKDLEDDRKRIERQKRLNDEQKRVLEKQLKEKERIARERQEAQKVLASQFANEAVIAKKEQQKEIENRRQRNVRYQQELRRQMEERERSKFVPDQTDFEKKWNKSLMKKFEGIDLNMNQANRVSRAARSRAKEVNNNSGGNDFLTCKGTAIMDRIDSRNERFQGY